MWGDIYINGSKPLSYQEKENLSGFWLNEKPIYSIVKVIDVSANSQISINLSELNYEVIWINQGKSFNQYDGTQTSSAINWYSGNNDYGLVYVNASRNLIIKNNSTFVRKYYLTLEYTKTTD